MLHLNFKKLIDVLRRLILRHSGSTSSQFYIARLSFILFVKERGEGEGRLRKFHITLCAHYSFINPL